MLTMEVQHEIKINRTFNRILVHSLYGFSWDWIEEIFLDWMEIFNELRKIPAHSSKLRVYSDSDYEFIEWLKSEINVRT